MSVTSLKALGLGIIYPSKDLKAVSMNITSSELLRKQSLMADLPHAPWVTKWQSWVMIVKAHLMRSLCSWQSPQETLKAACSQPCLKKKKSICTLRTKSWLEIHWNLNSDCLWVMGLQITFIFFFKSVFIFKSSWHRTLFSNQEKNFSWKGEAVSIHRFVHPGGKNNNSKGKAKNGIPKCCLEISGSSKELNKRWKIGEGPLLNL